MKNTHKLLLLFAVFFSSIADAACPACGHWELNRPDGSGGYLVIDQSKDKTLFNLQVFSSGDTPNQGLIDGLLKFKNGFAQYRTGDPPCQIDFRFNRSSITVTSHRKESFECGFSNGVVADGEYLKTP